MKTFWKFFFIQALAYSLCDASNRFVAQGNIAWSISSAMVYAFVAFEVIQSVGKADSIWAKVGYIAGGGLGTFIGIIVSRSITGI